jgi:hypothetical protein
MLNHVLDTDPGLVQHLSENKYRSRNEFGMTLRRASRQPPYAHTLPAFRTRSLVSC